MFKVGDKVQIISSLPGFISFVGQFGIIQEVFRSSYRVLLDREEYNRYFDPKELGFAKTPIMDLEEVFVGHDLDSSKSLLQVLYDKSKDSFTFVAMNDRLETIKVRLGFPELFALRKVLEDE